MGPLTEIFPILPQTPLEITVSVVAILGAILMIYGIFLEIERRQDAVFVIGSGALLVYALWIGNLVFAIAMGGFFIASFIEFIEIVLGKKK